MRKSTFMTISYCNLRFLAALPVLFLKSFDWNHNLRSSFDWRSMVHVGHCFEVYMTFYAICCIYGISLKGNHFGFPTWPKLEFHYVTFVGNINYVSITECDVFFWTYGTHNEDVSAKTIKQGKCDLRLGILMLISVIFILFLHFSKTSLRTLRTTICLN